MGQKGGIDLSIHSLRAAFKDTDSEAILLTVSKNASNSLNCDRNGGTRLFSSSKTTYKGTKIDKKDSSTV